MRGLPSVRCDLRVQRLVGACECRVAPPHPGVVDPPGAGEVAVGEFDRCQAGDELVHLLVPADADVGRVPDLLHRRQPALLEQRERRRHVVAGGAQRLRERERVLDRQPCPRSDREMRGPQRIAEQHQVAVAPARVPHRREVAPVRAVRHDRMAFEVGGEHPFAHADRFLGAHRIEAGPASSVGTISDSTFTGNTTACRRPGTAYDLLGVGDGGAASLNSDSGTFQIERNFFENNTGLRGGALAFINASFTQANIINNTLRANRGMASTGGVSFVNCCYAKLINNTFSDNRSGSDQFPSQYGGAFAINVGTLELVNNLVDNAGAGSPSCSYYFGQVTSSHNLYSDAACPLPTADPSSLVTGPMSWLGAPKNLGGSVLVMPPAYGSPAIDSGEDARC